MKVHRPGAVARAKRMAGAPCKRHRRGDLVGWLPIDNDGGTRWAIAEVYRCASCGLDMDPRLATDTIRSTQREAMEAYGLPQADIDAFFPKPPASSAVSVPLTGWPFPTSSRPELMATHAAREQAERAARATAMQGFA